jgi:GNAT superfamily N-acetyltransferase
MDPFRCFETTAGKILGLRARELRAGMPMESARFPEDYHPDTMHFAASAGGRIVGCLTLIRTTGGETPSWQLRGMATDKSWRNKGVGKNLLSFAEERLRTSVSSLPGIAGVQIWCNARTGAVRFYELQGYRRVSEEFMIENVGLHYKMEKKIL